MKLNNLSNELTTLEQLKENFKLEKLSSDRFPLIKAAEYVLNNKHFSGVIVTTANDILVDKFLKQEINCNLPPLGEVARSAEGGISFIIHAPHFAHGFNLAKKEKEESNLAIYREVKQFADELDAQFIIFHGGIDGDIKETARQLASFNEPRALIENKPYKALPNKMGGEFCRGYNLDEIKLVKETAKCGFCLDFGHAICAANSIFDNTPHPNPLPQGAREQMIYDYCKKFLQFEPNMYHLTDLNDITSPYDSHLHLGTGELDFKQIFDMIPDESYITFETVKNSKEDLNDFIEDMEWLKNFQ